MKALLAEPLLSPGHGATVIGKKDDQSLVQDALCLKEAEDAADPLIYDFDTAQVGIPVPAEEGIIWVARWEGNRLQRGFVESPGDGKGAVGFGDLELGKKALAGLAVAKVITVIKVGGGMGEVVVGFGFFDGPTIANRAGGGGVGDMPSSGAEERGQGLVRMG
jgi:hypothetical protein